MLRIEENERLTRVGPGTPMGNLLRRYWHPVAAVAELDANPVKPVKILSESLALFRDRQGRLGLIDETCPHRRVSFAYGIPEAEGLRCCYHQPPGDRREPPGRQGAATEDPWVPSATGQCDLAWDLEPRLG